MKFIQAKDLYFLSVFILIKAVGSLPSSKLKELVARGIAFCAYRLSAKKRRLSEKGVSETFGGKITEERRREIVEGSFYELWKETLSFSVSGKEKSMLKTAEVRGIEYLHDALKAGKGVILWECNVFGRRNLAKQILYENGFPACQVHTEHHIGGLPVRGFPGNMRPETWVQDRVLKPLFENYERQFASEIVYLPTNRDSLAFTRRLLELLKRNAIICARGDVGYGQKLISLKFLGRPKLFATGMVSLAKISGASLLPMFCIQERNDKARLILERPVNIKTDADREQGIENSVAEYVALLESYIMKYPGKCRSWHFLDKVYENPN